jgi:hypothetical protein
MIKISELILKAKKDKRKGSYQVYEEYKQELQQIAKDSVTYGDTLKIIANALKV